jgi:hypothetical protein
MKKLLLVAVGAAMLLAAPLTVSAQSSPMGPPGDRHQSEPYRPGDRSDHRPGMDRHDQRPSDGYNSRYGRWERSWGARPTAPPRRFSNSRNWYRHVRACQLRYRSYNARTDLYMVRRGVMARCRL